MTSRPLFIIEAESMVIFWPMLQFGCFKRLRQRRLLDVGRRPRCGTARPRR